MHAVEIGASAFQQGHDALRRAWAQQRHALGQAADIVGVEAVHIFIRTDALEQQRGVQVLGQRQLHQDAVDGRVFVELVDQGEQIGLAGLGRQVVGAGEEADFFAILAFM